MRLTVILVGTALLAGCTAMMVGGGSSKSTTAPTSQSQRAADSALRSQIQSKLAAHPEIGVFDVGVAVSRGYVTLSGEVQGYAAREAAEKIAMSTDGVDGVRNSIKVNASK